MNGFEIKPIAKIYTDFQEKFGIPRQSGIIESLEATIIFEPEYRDPDALRGLEEYSHIWILWQFSECVGKDWTPTVRPPKLGGNVRKGVFATRSPFRPNNIGLSCVKLKAIENTKEFGKIIKVSGADILDGTPIFDIKPYLPYTDAHPEATSGFSVSDDEAKLEVDFPCELLNMIPETKRDALICVLEQNPRPGYHHSDTRIYGMLFGGYNVSFIIAESKLKVTDVTKL